MNKIYGLTTYNNWAYTRLCLESFFKYTDLTDSKLIVYDNRSTDETLERILVEFPQIHKLVIVPEEEDCISTIWNMMIDEAIKSDSDLIIIPNDLVFSPSWAKYLEEDLYKLDDRFVCGSPYLPVDYQYDDVINQDFAEKYLVDYRGKLDANTSYDTLKQYIQELYIDWESFCENFSERNKNENPLDGAATHVMYYKGEALKKYNIKYDERYRPWGSHEFDQAAQLSSQGLFSMTSSRAYCHHWISVTHRSFQSEKQKKIYNSTIKLLQKWEWVPDSTVFANIPAPKNIPNWRTPYHKFKLRDTELSFEEAQKVPATKYMSFQALQPGHNYYGQVHPGSIMSVSGKSYIVVQNNDDRFYCTDKNYPHVSDDKVIYHWEKPNIDYYYRTEEENYYGPGHFDFLLEK